MNQEGPSWPNPIKSSESGQRARSTPGPQCSWCGLCSFWTCTGEVCHALYPSSFLGPTPKHVRNRVGTRSFFISMILIMTMNVILSYLGLPQYKTEAKPMRSLDRPSACTELELLNMKVCINGGCHKLSNNR